MTRTKKAAIKAKARQQLVKHEDKNIEKVDVKIEGLKDEDYDDSNKLVLPSKKKKSKIKVHNVPKARKLSKKQRKKLEKIVEVRDKKQKRAGLLEALQSVQATEAEMKLLTSTKEIHNRKLKRHLEIEETPSGIVKINAISGSKKKQKLQETIEVSEESESTESSSSDSDMESETETDIVKDNVADANDQTQDANLSKHDDKDSKPKQDTKTGLPEKSSGIKPKDSKTEPLKKTVHIPINRIAAIQEERLKLPIIGEEQVIMEVISDNSVVILCGETGSGKTTQVPQFLYEAGYAHDGGIIGITEPRRVAAISMSKRVAQEMNLTTSQVSYQIRYEGNVTKETKVKFMTDGVLLKEIQKDFLLSKYSVIIIDEAHERSVYTDILIGLLSRIVPLREKKGISLKLIIMSATLRVEDFTENSRLFKVTPPVIKIVARQYPVAVHFNKRTPVEDYLGEAFKKVCKIHRQLPDGGILVFVTGQQEVHTLCTKLRDKFPFKKPAVIDGKDAKRKRKNTDEMDEEKPKLPEISLDDFSVLPLDEEAEIAAVQNQSDAELSDDMGLEDDEDIGESKKFRPIENEQPLHVLPLYSLLASDRQARVFQPPPDGTRLCIVATNVAETSLTIPNVKYVVDTGKVKTKFYDKVTGVSTFHVTWTSKASANQRAGRAGRTSPGHCYRLYSSAVFNDEFEKFSPPEITRRPVEDLVLQMKDMNIDKVVNFPFPTMPSLESLKAAESLLISLGALEKPPTPRQHHRKKVVKEVMAAKITPLGRAMACFPVSPRYGKMLSLGHQHNLLPYVVIIVSALSVQEIFIEIHHHQRGTDGEKEDLSLKNQRIKQIRKAWAGQGHSLLLGDLMVLLKAVGACVYAGGGVGFCERHGIRYKAMLEVNKLRAQLTNAVNAVIPEADLVLDPKMTPPSDLQAKLLRQIVLTGLGDHVARKMPEPAPGSDDAKKLKHAYQSLILDDPVFIHPGSVLYREKADYVVFQHIEETSKLYMKGLCVIEPEWLPVFVPSQCSFSKPLEDPPPSYDEESGTVVCRRTSTFGSHFWQVGPVQVEHPPDLDRYKWFARFLLEGKVIQKLRKFVPSLLSTPTTMVKAWAKLQPRTEVLLSALVKEEVDCRDNLRELWTQQSDYLLTAYLTWIPEVQHDEVKQMWPPG